MAEGGTRIYCPNCKAFSVCKRIPATSLGKRKAQRWYRNDFRDVAWFRRARRCLSCGYEFLTAELDEAFVTELTELRRRLARKQRRTISSIRQSAPWLKREETIPIDLAKRFIRSTAWWLTHSSGRPVRAPRHADRIYMSDHGWAIDFGANTFLVGKAIERSRNTLNSYMESASRGCIPLKSELISSLKTQVSGAVANIDGHEYAGFYPISEQDLVFGAQSIDVSDAANFIIQESGIEVLLLDK